MNKVDVIAILGGVPPLLFVTVRCLLEVLDVRLQVLALRSVIRRLETLVGAVAQVLRGKILRVCLG